MAPDNLHKNLAANSTDGKEKAKKIRERSSQLMRQRNTATTKTRQKIELPKIEPMARSPNTLKEHAEQATGCEDDAGRLKETIAQLQLQLQIANIGQDDKDNDLQAELRAAKNQVSVLRSKYATVNAELTRRRNTDSSKVKELQNHLELLKKKNNMQADENLSRVTQLRSKVSALEKQTKRQVDEIHDMKVKAECLDQCNLRLQENETRLVDLAGQIRSGEHIQPPEHQDTGLCKLQLQIIDLQKQNFELNENVEKLKSNCGPRSCETVTLSDIRRLQREQEQTKHNINAIESKLFIKIEENDKLHQQLEARAADNEAIKKENAAVHTLNADLKAQAKVYAAEADLIEVIEAQSEMLNGQLATAVEEVRSKDSVIYYWKTQADTMQRQFKELESTMHEYNSQRAADEGSRPFSAVNHHVLYPSTDIKADRTDTVPPSSTTSVSSHMPAVKAVPAKERFVIDSDMESISSGSHTFGESNHTPIIVYIDPLDRLNWTWVQKMRAAVQRQPVTVDGPREHVIELIKLMNDYEIGDTQRKKQVATQRRLLAHLEKDIEKFKAMPLCRNKKHKCLADDLAARIEQDELNRMRLHDQDRHLKDLENSQRQSDVEIRHLKEALNERDILLDLAVTNGFLKVAEKFREQPYAC